MIILICSKYLGSIRYKDFIVFDCLIYKTLCFIFSWFIMPNGYAEKCNNNEELFAGYVTIGEDMVRQQGLPGASVKLIGVHKKNTVKRISRYADTDENGRYKLCVPVEFISYKWTLAVSHELSEENLKLNVLSNIEDAFFPKIKLKYDSSAKRKIYYLYPSDIVISNSDSHTTIYSEVRYKYGLFEAFKAKWEATDDSVSLFGIEPEEIISTRDGVKVNFTNKNPNVKKNYVMFESEELGKDDEPLRLDIYYENPEYIKLTGRVVNKLHGGLISYYSSINVKVVIKKEGKEGGIEWDSGQKYINENGLFVIKIPGHYNRRTCNVIISDGDKMILERSHDVYDWKKEVLTFPVIQKN